MIWGVEVIEIHVGKESSQASVLDTVEVLYLDTEEVWSCSVLKSGGIISGFKKKPMKSKIFLVTTRGLHNE